MNTKITFHNMPSSDPLETHAREKIKKCSELLKDQADRTPFFIEIWLKANKQHPHHAAEIHLKTGSMNLHAHNEGPDMYVVIDTAIDKMVSLIKKEKALLLDRSHKPDTEKKRFSR